MPVRILSVDDEQDLEILLTQYFRRKIKKGEYEFSFAHNGVEALQMILTQPYDIILSDINMPEMDGLTLLTKINEMRNPALKCIMVSAYGDMENIRTAMNRGAFDFTTKPINLEDMELTIEKAIEQIRFVKNAQHEHTQLKSIQSDLKVAKEIQETILPKTFPPFPEWKSFDIYASMQAAAYVGGDFYDFFKIDNDRLGFVVADVSGKGIPAAIFMAISRTVIRAIAVTENSAAQCMKRSNSILCQESVNDMFVTVFYGILNINSGLVTYCNAGHNPPILIKQNGDTSYIPLTNDMILGAIPEAEYHEKELKLEPGDNLFLYTDGITEAMNREHELYGEERLLENCKHLAGSSAMEAINKITETVGDFTIGAVQSDDITLLSLVFNG
ncbi:sigma-B regulation protein RsbU (phosphoserine phosphatase) [Parabacteroides sp. PF5-5]|uniref:PP2C family protein-serine/threonine phosphatase n=1 Tax=unclassified Parabacteroides TaxID=2649774 RepID=UPI0024744DEB|nr:MULTISPECIES: SpoIIE family protein phosphatase [unclassified Parabacteroides]MDH6304774.1 sigma-B regulation protein RsbU (phosphoserine phosphatase) [Parabacteroides sp. PH5-39]MDH6315611.1 sigma-B regulation protein RsbU (phosphoserine phosphatase) [Parabacteroides sp. PF5-13]MDH6319272.1 sigma-B regulation protein RsbU (phosphoserine phosphatase) [Parabacteroides sp. PH5-13]MDH6323003.1 sigma-B regulation protein RsbU (phosphoserine phosphatase) [Parabacteroides sp. PH5-8]MDH6326804.1 s